MDKEQLRIEEHLNGPVPLMPEEIKDLLKYKGSNLNDGILRRALEYAVTEAQILNDTLLDMYELVRDARAHNQSTALFCVLKGLYTQRQHLAIVCKLLARHSWDYAGDLKAELQVLDQTAWEVSHNLKDAEDFCREREGEEAFFAAQATPFEDRWWRPRRLRLLTA